MPDRGTAYFLWEALSTLRCTSDAFINWREPRWLKARWCKLQIHTSNQILFSLAPHIWPYIRSTRTIMPMLTGSVRLTKDLSIGKKAKYVLLTMRTWNKKVLLFTCSQYQCWYWGFLFFLVFCFVSLIWIFQPEIFAADGSEIDRCSSISKNHI